jgi:hypothetical protein
MVGEGVGLGVEVPVAVTVDEEVAVVVKIKVRVTAGEEGVDCEVAVRVGVCNAHPVSTQDAAIRKQASQDTTHPIFCLVE